jgi:hypothetical protein
MVEDAKEGKGAVKEDPNVPKSRFFEGACRVCGGDITEDIVQKFNPMHGPPIFGPGSKSQYYYTSNGLYCKGCGLKYEFVPGEEQGDKEK